jgi:hypothetical protein
VHRRAELTGQGLYRRIAVFGRDDPDLGLGLALGSG